MKNRRTLTIRSPIDGELLPNTLPWDEGIGVRKRRAGLGRQ